LVLHFIIFILFLNFIVVYISRKTEDEGLLTLAKERNKVKKYEGVNWTREIKLPRVASSFF